MTVFNQGQKCFGENYVQELAEKKDLLPEEIEWHFIGHLQTNKVKYIAPFVTCIQTVDSLKLLTEINKQAGKYNRTIDCLLQVYIATEETKFGLDYQETENLLSDPVIGTLSCIRIIGLMGMASNTDDPVQVRREFRGLKEFLERMKKNKYPSNVDLKELSMGMSADYQIALEEGSTLVRIGSAIFGERVYSKTS